MARLTTEQKDEIANRYSAGEKPSVIAADFGVAVHHVHNIRQARGLPLQRAISDRRKFTEAEWQMIREAWDRYDSVESIAERLGGICENALRQRLYHAGYRRDQVVSKYAGQCAPAQKEILLQEGEAAFVAAMKAERVALQEAKAARREINKRLARHAVQQAERNGTFDGMSRNEIIRWKRDVAGLTLQEIGDEYGVTEERIRQLCGGKKWRASS